MSDDRVSVGARNEGSEWTLTRLSSFEIKTTTSWCTTCRADMAFEQPDCLEDHGHGVDCPEWACVDCGEAVFVGFGVSAPVARVTRASHVA
jgi:hypothetical protein